MSRRVADDVRGVRPAGAHQALAQLPNCPTRAAQAPPLHPPSQQTRKPPPPPHPHRLAPSGRAVPDHRLPLRPRVAACLMLLYAQPVNRLIRLTTDDVTQQDGEVFLHLGDPPAPVPEPFAALLLQLATSQQNTTTASPRTRWLFPGQKHRAATQCRHHTAAPPHPRLPHLR